MRIPATIATDHPVLVFGGPYGNLEATLAVLDDARRLGIPAERIVCTGDVVAYCSDPVATIDAVRDAGIHVVMGNCEASLASGSEDCGCGFEPGSSCDRLSAAWYAFADGLVDAGRRAWMAGLPRRIDIVLGGIRLAVVHGGLNDISAFNFASTPAAAKLADLCAAGVDGIVGGHCGLPFTQSIEGFLWHNPGVVGLPANDGTPRVWYSILTPSASGLRIAHRALEYGHAGAASKMRAAGLPDGYADALEQGVWPSCDVLPVAELAARGIPLEAGEILCRPHWRAVTVDPACDPLVEHHWPDPHDRSGARGTAKFENAAWTAAGEPRAQVALTALRTLWVNTGTLCNIECRNCYIESGPRNDRLAYFGLDELRDYLDEIDRLRAPTDEIGFTGGEPFMNPDFLAMIELCLRRSFRVLVLTNAMRPMRRLENELLAVVRRVGGILLMRVSLDHFTRERHDEERGPGAFDIAIDGLKWLSQSGFTVSVAGRAVGTESEAEARSGYARLFAEHGLAIDAADPAGLVIFPEMDGSHDVPEISEGCWSRLGMSPGSVMCASSRMVVKRRGRERPSVVACTLLPYDEAFEMGDTLAAASGPIRLNHPHCARFCVLGGASCSGH